MAAERDGGAWIDAAGSILGLRVTKRAYFPVAHQTLRTRSQHLPNQHQSTLLEFGQVLVDFGAHGTDPSWTWHSPDSGPSDALAPFSA
jgi:hypothetical protein